MKKLKNKAFIDRLKVYFRASANMRLLNAVKTEKFSWIKIIPLT